MTAHVRQFIVSLVAVGWLLAIIAPPVEASCGSVSCFVVIGSQQQVPMAGLLTVNAIYSYTPSEAPPGEGGSIPFADQGNRTLTLASLNASQIRTLTRTATLDMNYGLTERFGIQVALPYKHVNSDAQIGGLNPVPYGDKGLGDIRIAVKYNALPTLRSMIVVGIGADLPTGDYGQRVQGGSLAESTLQIGRGSVGLVPTLYQSYELIPHRLNQFALASYRHTFKNSDGYQFGDEVKLSAGLNIIPLEQTPWLVQSLQHSRRLWANCRDRSDHLGEHHHPCLTGTPYTSYGITPDGRFLLLRGQTLTPQATKLGVLDLSVTPAVRTEFTIPELDGTSPGSFKFSPNGNRFYILAGNTATSTKKDKLFAFDSSTLTATTPALTLLREIPLVATSGHGLDVLVQGSGEAKYVVVSNSTDNSISIINATDNQEKQKVTVGPTPGGVMVYEPGAAAAGNQATSSLTAPSKAKPSVLSDQLDDHGMPK